MYYLCLLQKAFNLQQTLTFLVFTGSAQTLTGKFHFSVQATYPMLDLRASFGCAFRGHCSCVCPLPSVFCVGLVSLFSPSALNFICLQRRTKNEENYSGKCLYSLFYFGRQPKQANKKKPKPNQPLSNQIYLML